jgi:hypothetical protein
MRIKFKCPRPDTKCGYKGEFNVVGFCDVCESKHYHMKCPVCFFEFNCFENEVIRDK